MALSFGSKQERIEQLEAELKSANEQIEELTTAQEELATAREEITAQTERADKSETEVKDLTKALEESNESLTKANEKLDTFDDEADKRAREIVASTGHEPVKETKSDQEDDVLAQFNSLKGADATEFFSKNKEAIMTARRKASK